MTRLRRAAASVTVATACALLTACSSGDGEQATAPPTTVPAQATTTTSPPAPATTAATATTAPTRVTTTTAVTAEGQARALFAAWMGSDRAAADKVAAPDAVAALFARRWQAADGWSLAECSGAAGSLICTWQRPGGQQLLFRVQNRTGGGAVTVAEVRFQP